MRVDKVLFLGTLLPSAPFLTSPLGQSAVRGAFYVAAVLLCIALLHLFLLGGVRRSGFSAIGTRRADMAALLVLVASLWALWVGIWRGNDIAFIVGDLFRSAVFALGIIIGGRLRSRQEVLRALEPVWRAVVLIAVTRTSIFLVLLALGGYARFGGGSVVDVVLAVGYLLGRIPRVPVRWPVLMYTVGPTLVVFNNVFSLERSRWIAIVLSATLFLVHSASLRTACRVAVGAVVSFPLIGTVVLFTDSPVEHAVRGRWAQTIEFDAGADSSYASRAEENEAAGEAFTALPLSGPAGAGYGFTYFLPHRAETVHQIHNTYLSVWLRHGSVAGSLLLSVIGIAVLRSVVRFRGIAIAVVPVAVLVSAATAVVSYSFLGDIVLGVFVGVLASGVLKVGSPRIR